MPQELLVVNKTDVAGDLQLARLRHLVPDAIFVSAHRGDGIARLRARIAELLPRPEVEIDLLLPYVEGSLVARVHAEGDVLSEEHTPQGTLLHARVGGELAGAVLPFAVPNGSGLNGSGPNGSGC
jgi:GTP-binding protein HflX